jgi:hypothetical protein
VFLAASRDRNAGQDPEIGWVVRSVDGQSFLSMWHIAPRTRADAHMLLESPPGAYAIEVPPMTRLSSEDRRALSDGQFAFPNQRKEPLENAAHVRNAVARFDQVKGVSDADRDIAWSRIRAAAKLHDVIVHESDWRELPTRSGG